MTLGDDIKNVYASKYLTYLPTKEELIKIIRDEKELIELAKENEKDNVNDFQEEYKMSYEYIFFDFDGTLVNTVEGTAKSAQ